MPHESSIGSEILIGDDSVLDRNHRWRVAVCLSHPIQYQVPLLRKLAQHPQIELTVYFMTDTGLREKNIRGYGQAIKWDVPVLSGYHYNFLDNNSWDPDGGRPWSTINLSILRELRKGRFDALIVNGYYTVTDWLAFCIAKVTRTPVFFRGEVYVDSAVHVISQRRLRDVFRKIWCHGLDAGLAVSTRAREYYVHYGVPLNRIFWTPLAVDNDYWMTHAEELAPRKPQLKVSLGLDPELPVILFVAHMRPQKRPLDLVAAFEKLEEKANLVMVGGGPLYDAVKDYCARRSLSGVQLVGVKNQTELSEYYALADIFVMSSGPGEINPLVVHEAMCFGLPLVLSDAIPSIVDVVYEGVNGCIYRVGDTEQLATKLDELLANSELRLQMGANSREINSHWSNEVCVQGILDALASAGRRPTLV